MAKGPERRLAVRLYALSSCAFPASLRRRYGAEMVEAFAAGYAQRLRQGGAQARRYAWRACFDALRAGLRERFLARGLRRDAGTRLRRDAGGGGLRRDARDGLGVINRPATGPISGEGEGNGMGSDLQTGRGRGGWAVGMEARLALRSLARSPVFTLTVLVVIALGAGINGAIFTAVEAALLSPLPYPEPERLVLLDLTDTTRAGETRAFPWSWAKYRILAETRELAADPIAAYAKRDLTLTGRGEPARLAAEVITPDYFDVLGVPLALGRSFDAEGEEGEVRQVVLGQALWRERFGGDPVIIGRTVTLNGETVTVVGVAAAGFRGLTGAAALWVPVGSMRLLVSPILLDGAQSHWLQAIGRLRPAATPERLRSQMQAVAGRVHAAYPDPTTVLGGGARSLAVARRNPQARLAVSVVWAAAGLVLLIACANLAALLLARGRERRREIAVRLALGASRKRVVAGLLGEVLLLAGAGGVLGLVVAAWGVDAVAAAWPQDFVEGAWNLRFVDATSFGLDPTAGAFTLGLALLTGAVFGVGPALRLTRADLGSVLREGAGGTRADRGAGLVGRRALVAAEVCLALVLLVGAGLMGASLSRLLEVEHGFDADRLLTFEYSLPRSSAAAQRPAAFHEELLERIRALPGALDATLGCEVPLDGHCWFAGVKQVGDTLYEEGSQPRIGVHPVDHHYFDTLRVPLLRGRTFDATDRSDSQPVVVINQTAARTLFADRDPIGQRFAATVAATSEDAAEVVGVVGDVLYDAPEQGVTAEAYFSHRQEPGPGATVIVRTVGEPFDLLPAIRAELAALDPDLPIDRITTVADAGAARVKDTRVVAALLSLFAGVAVLLAVTGVWGVVAYGVSQRRRELGVRMSLGATSGQVVRLVLRRGLDSVIAGLLLGILVALASTRALGSFLYEVSASDPSIFVAGAALIFAVALLAAWLPARRATRIDPALSLRRE